MARHQSQFGFIILAISLSLARVSARDINEIFQCYMTYSEELDISRLDDEKYVVIEQKETRRAITSFRVCKSLGQRSTVPSDFVIYTVDCFESGMELLTSVTSAVIVDVKSSDGALCRDSTREVESPPTTTTTTTVATTTAKKRSTSAAEVNVTTSTPTTVTSTEQDFSSMMLLQVLDETGYMSDEVKMTDSIRLKVQALTTLDYKAPVVNRCWYSLHNETRNLTEPLDDVLIIEYGCSLKEPVLLESIRLTEEVFESNGPLDATTPFFTLQSLNDLEFEQMTFQCEVDLCMQDQMCRTVCPADGNTYRVPVGETIQANLTTTIYVEKTQTTTEPPTTKKKRKPKTENPLIIRHREKPAGASRAQKSGMESMQPYIVIGVGVIGVIIVILLFYITYRIVTGSNPTSAANSSPESTGKGGQPGMQEPFGKGGQPSMVSGTQPGMVSGTQPSMQEPFGKGGLVGHQAGGMRLPYGGPGGMKMYGSPPPSYYNNNNQIRGRLTSTPGQNMTQPLLDSTSPTRGRSSIPQQTELPLSPGHLSELPSRYQDSFGAGTILGGEYYPFRAGQDVRTAGPLAGRELNYLPEWQLEDNLRTREADKRVIGSILAREAALRQATSAKRTLFSPSEETDGNKHSDVTHLISKSLSEYVDRHGVEGLSNLGQTSDVSNLR